MISHMGNLKKIARSELIYKTKRDSDIEHKLMANKGRKVERDNYEYGISRYKLCVCVCVSVSWLSCPLFNTLLCPQNFPGKNTGVGCHFLLQGLFMIHGSNPHLLCWQEDSLPLCHLGSLRHKLLLTK